VSPRKCSSPFPLDSTPEFKAFLEQGSTFICRLMDAASSGASKQFVQDSQTLVWKGIEMATDPATTLALAEVTAHLCHAVEETHESIHVERGKRDAQNKTLYMNPLLFSVDYEGEYSIEDVILSCLGSPYDESRENDDIPSNVIWDTNLSTATPAEVEETTRLYQEWSGRDEKVNVKLLRERILPGRKSAQSSVTSVPVGRAPVVDRMPVIPSNEEMGHDATSEKDPVEKTSAPEPISVEEHWNMEAKATPDENHFYSTLDALLMKPTNVPREQATPNAPTASTSKNEKKDSEEWTPRVKRFKSSRSFRKNNQRERFQAFKQLSKRHQRLLLLGAILLLYSLLLASAFCLYGVYTFGTAILLPKVQEFRGVPRNLPRDGYPASPPVQRSSSPTSNSEIIIRVVREVVHVREDGSLIEKEVDTKRPVLDSELERMSECVASALDESQ